MREPDKLTKKQLVIIIKHIRDELWLDESTGKLDIDKRRKRHLISNIEEILDWYELGPE